MLRNDWLKWFERRIQFGRINSRRRRSGKRLAARAACIAEALEQRTLLTTFTVDNPIDELDGNSNPGDLSLREAIFLANSTAGADTIQFAANLDGAVLNQTLGNLNITDDVSIIGSANPIIVNNAGIVIQANGAGDMLTVSMTGIAVNNNVFGSTPSIRSVTGV